MTMTLMNLLFTIKLVSLACFIKNTRIRAKS